MATFSGECKEADGQWYVFKDTSGTRVVALTADEMFNQMKNTYGRDDITVVKHQEISYTDTFTDPV